MEWKIEDRFCWICGKSENITYHHTLPKHWKPINNIVIPICSKCHNRLNAEDLAGMHSFAFKIEQELGRQVSLWGQIRTNLDKYCAAQEIIIGAFKKKENDERTQ